MFFLQLSRRRSFLLLFALFLISVSVFASPVYLLSDDQRIPSRSTVRGPVNPNTIDELSTLFPLTRTDGSYEYYLGSGAAGDTFAVVLEPAAPCSVYAVQFQFNDAGNY